MRTYLLLAALLCATCAQAHENHSKDAHALRTYKAEQMPFGIAGDPAKVTRTIKISMLDTMRFVPDKLEIKRGETVRFVLKNEGKLLHEMVIGTMADLKEHAKLMREFPNMEHDAPHMVHVEPGHTGEIVWHFNRAGDFDFACLLPGHFEAGMVGKILVK
ncbi:MAG TPA: cupredoxin family protein [Burkholderiales bacterium]|nr:cupredoxin family protein [Burkholderiales bacterium]